MNKIFKVIWSVKLQRKVVASEYAKSSGATSSVTVSDALPAQGFKFNALWKILVLSGLLVAPLTAQAKFNTNQQIKYNLSSSNTQSGSVELKHRALNSSTLLYPAKLETQSVKDGGYQYNYATVLFRPEFYSATANDLTKEYSFLESRSPVDGVMAIYDGAYNPKVPSENGMVGDDDYNSFAPGSDDRIVTPNDFGLNKSDLDCGTDPAKNTTACPGLFDDLVNGDAYTLWFSTHKPDQSSSLLKGTTTLHVGSDVKGAGPGGVIGEFANPADLQDIVKRGSGSTAWDSYDLNFKVRPDFRGGTLRLYKPETLGYAANVFNQRQKFTLSHDASNTLDANGHDAAFLNVWSDVDGQKGVITVVNTAKNLANVTFSAANTFSGGMTIGKNVNVILADGELISRGKEGDMVTTKTFGDLGTGYVDVQQGGQYTLAKGTATTFNNVLKGSGNVVINLTDPTLKFSVAKTTGHDFTGQVQLNSGTLDASKNNLSLVNKAGAQFVVQNKGVLNINQGPQGIAGNLKLDGGTIGVALGSQLSVNTLSVSNQPKLTVAIDDKSFNQTGNLVAQSNNAQPMDIIKATNVEKSSIGQALEVALYGQDGKPVVGNSISVVLDNGYGTKDLTANYGTGDVKVTDRGINLALGLTSLNSGSKAKISAQDLTGAQTMNALLTGKNFDFYGNAAGLTIAKANTYTGATNIAAGKVISGINESFGKTSQLNVATGATLDLAGHTQTIANGGQISGQVLGQKGTLALSDGTLVITDQAKVSDVTLSSKKNKTTVKFTGGDATFKGNIVDAIGVTRDGTKGTTTTLVGNIKTSGTLNIQNGHLRLGDGQSATVLDSNVAINNSASQLILDLGKDHTTALRSVTGQGRLINQSGNLDVLNPQSYTGGTVINNGKVLVKNSGVLGAGAVHVAKGATLTLQELLSKNFNQALTGDGVVAIDSRNQTFSLGKNVGTGFKGEFDITSSEMEIDQSNSSVFGQASLTLNDQANLTVSSDVTAKTVTLNDGANLNLSANPTTLKANGQLSVDALKLNAGQINITLGDNSASGTQITDGQEVDAATLFDQGTGRIDSISLITSNQAVTLDKTAVMVDGQTVDVTKGDEIDTTKMLKQNGQTVAKVHYGDGISTQQGTQHGLFVTQGLHSVEALKDQNIAIATTEKSKDKTFNTLVTGEGGVSLDASKGTMNFGHEGNSYQGGTTVTAGTVKLAEKEGFGVGAMTVAKDAAVDLNGQQQTITTLNNEGSLNLNQGALTITGNTDIAGVTGAGQLAIQGVSTVNTVNEGLTANIAIDQTGTLNLDVDNGLGQGQMALAGTLNANSDLTLANQLSGAGQLNINKAVTLTSNNAAFTGNINIDQAGTLTVSGLPQLGNGQKIEIAKEGDLVLNKISGALKQALSGGGDVVIADGSQITLTGNNADFSGIYKVQGVHQVPSTLTVTDAKQLGKGQIEVNDNGVVDAQYTGNWQTNVTGTGIVNVADQHQITLTDPSKLADTLTVNVSEKGQLNLKDDAFNSALTGSGIVKVDADKENFTFGDQVGTKFAGTFDINNANFTLYPTNHAIVQNANIIANAGSVISVESQGVTKTKNFTLNDGGVLHFTGKINDHSSESGTLQVADLVLNQGGLVKVEAEGYQSGQPNIPYDGGNLSEEDLFSRSIKDRTLQLVFADQVTKAEGLAIEINGEKVLLDDDQNSANTRVNVKQNDEVVGVVDYTSNAATQNGDQKGLFITSGLHQVDIYAGKNLAMASTAGSEKEKVELLVTGAGGLVLNAAKANMQFGNIGNTYKGDTKVTAGTVTLIADNAFGEAAHLDVAQGAVVNLGGKTQEINQLNNDGTVALEKGTLEITDDSQLQGLTGEGQLIISGGEATVNAVNQGLAANVTVKDTGALNLNVQDGLGQGNFVIDGTLSVGKVETLSNNLSGQGNINIHDSVALSGTNTEFTGTMDVQAQKAVSINGATNLGKAQLKLGDQSALNITGTVGELQGSVTGNGQVNIKDNGQLMIKKQDQFSKTVGMNVDKNATLNLETTGFDSALTGEGLVSINAQQGDFALGKNVGNAFAGTVAIANGQVALNQENAQTLSNANVVLDAEGQLTVAADASAKTIAVKKGTVKLSGDAATGQAEGLLTTDTLTIDGGTIDLTVKGFGDGTGAIDAETESLFELASDGKQLQFIATKNALDISQANIALNGQNMAAETDTRTAINAAGEQVANAVYSNRISTAQKNQHGLFLDSHLSSIDILDQKNLTIRGEQGKTQDFSTTMTGQGAATFDATQQALTISGQNSYTGGTTLVGGVVTAQNGQAFGEQGSLNIKEGATLALGADLTVGQTTAAGDVSLQDHALSFTKGDSTLSGKVSGNGQLNVMQNSTLHVSDAADLGTAKLQIAKDGRTNIDKTSDYTFNQALSGEGELKLSAAGNQLSIGDQVGNDFKGTLLVESGKLSVDGTKLQGSSLSVEKGSEVTILKDTTHKNVTVNGGDLIFEEGNSPERADGIITAENLNLNNGTVFIEVKKDWTTTTPTDGITLEQLLEPTHLYQLGQASGNISISQKDMTLDLIINGQHIDDMTKPVQHTVTLKDGRKVLVDQNYFLGHDQLITQNGQGGKGLYAKYGNQKLTFVDGLDNDKDHNIDTGGSTVSGGDVGVDNSGTINTGGGNTETDKGDINNQPGGTINTGGGDVTNNGNGNTNNGGTINTGGGDVTNKGDGDINNDPGGTIITDGGNVGTDNGNINNKGEIDTSKPNDKGGDVTAGKDINNTKPDTGNPDDGTITTGGGKVASGGDLNNRGDIDTSSPKDDQGHTIVDNNGNTIPGGNVDVGGVLVNGDKDGQPNTGTIHTGGGDVTVTGQKPDGTNVQPGDNALTNNKGSDIDTGGMTDPQGKPSPGGNVVVNNGDIDNHGTINTDGGNVGTDNGNIKNHDTGTITTGGGDVTVGGKDTTLTNDGSIHTGGGNATTNDGDINNNPGGTIITDGGKVEAGGDHNINNKGEIDTSKPNEKGGDVIAGKDINNTDPGTGNSKDGTITTGGGQVVAGGDLNNKGDIDTSSPKDDQGHTIVDNNGKPVKGGDVNVGGILINGDKDGQPSTGTIHTGGGDVTVAGNKNGTDLKPGDNALTNNKGSDINTGGMTDPQGKPLPGGNVVVNNGDIDNYGTIATEGGKVGTDNGNIKNHDTGTITTGGGEVTSSGNLENTGQVDTAAPKDDQGHTIVDNNGQPVKGGDVNVGGILINGDKDGQPSTGTIHTGGGNVTVTGTKPDGTPVQPGDNALTNNKGSDINTGGMTDPQGKPLPGGNVVVNNGDLDNAGTITTEGGDISVDNGSIINHDTGTITTGGGNIAVNKDVNNDGLIDLGGGEMTVEGNFNNNAPKGTLIIGQKEDGSAGKVEVDKNFNNTGKVDFGGGELVIKDTGSTSSDGGLTGDGTLTINQDADFTVKGKNDDLGKDTNVNIADQGTVTIEQGGSLGGATIDNSGELTLQGDKVDDNAVKNSITGKGHITIEAAPNTTQGKVELAGDNQGFGGEISVTEHGDLIIRNDMNRLGGKDTVVDLSGQPSNLTIIDVPTGDNASHEMNQTIKGSGNINFDNSKVNITSENTDFKGQINLNQGSEVSITDNARLGSPTDVMIDDTSGLVLDGFKDDQLTAKVGGSGDLIFTNGTKLDSDKVNIGDDIGFNLRDQDTVLNGQDGEFNHRLKGKGSFNVTGNGGDFTLGEHVGNEFAGTVNLENTKFTLTDGSADALGHATLNINKDAQMNFGDHKGDVHLDQLHLQEGSLVFNNGVRQDWAVIESNNVVHVDTLDLSQQKGGITVEKFLHELDPSVKGNSLIELNVGEPAFQLLATKNGVKGALTSDLALTLKDDQGAEISTPSVLNLTNKGTVATGTDTVVAEGSFDYGLSTGANEDGLYVSYQMKDLTILDGNTVAIEGVQGRNNTLTANIDERGGKGGIEIHNDAANNAVTLSGKNTFSGDATVISGGLKVVGNEALGNADRLVLEQGTFFDLNGTTQKANSVSIAEGASFYGTGTMQGDFMNQGLVQVGRPASSNGQMRMQAVAAPSPVTLEIKGNFTNANTIDLRGQAVGNALVIHGNYVGQNGLLNMNVARHGQTVNADQLVITGHASGQTKVTVYDISGLLGTVDDAGVKLISTGGSDANAFTLGNLVTQGAYQYQLTQADKDWFLKSLTTRPDTGNNLSNTGSTTQSQVPGLGGPGFGGGLINGAGGLRSLSRLQAGGSSSEDAVFLDSSLWNTTAGGKHKGRTSGGTVHYDYDYYNTTFGGDQLMRAGNSLVQLGVFIGTMEAKSDSHSIISGSHGKGKVTGQTYGIYGSWYADGNNPLTPYVDGILSYGSYKNKITTEGNPQDSYRSHVWSFTLQGGYPIDLGNNLVIEPQAQITYLDFSAKDYVDVGGTRVSQSLKGDVVGRVGAFIYPKDGDIRPYAGMNLWYDDTRAVVYHNNDRNEGYKGGLMYEAKAGVGARLDKNFSLSVDANYRQGKHKSKDYGASLTLKYTF
ncbi:ESPR-type extended signal peptide-containing protein [Wohlfahrtiimonas chitiniclastica]|uniref:ESPR-type extended signal peptide-containing protein n=1 Tax=Wohlfahrtiimonas chitiniclastica TaxID=400946 RepID=UPI0011D17369|nr:ESPR-type extended signal peptide-containing protein [Wohlfahrtiimonas chitiniclastica]